MIVFTALQPTHPHNVTPRPCSRPPGVGKHRAYLKKHLLNILIGSQLPSGPKARLYTSLGPSPQVPAPRIIKG